MGRREEARRSAFLGLQALTFARLPLALGYGWFLESSRFPLAGGGLTGALGLLAILELTDSLDGWLARRYGLFSSWGEAFDPLMDSLSRFVVFWSLARCGAVWTAVPLIMLLRDIIVAYCRLASLLGGGPIAASWSGKTKAVVQGTSALVATLLLGAASWEPAWTSFLSWLVGGVTVLSGLQYVWRATQATMRGNVSGKFE